MGERKFLGEIDLGVEGKWAERLLYEFSGLLEGLKEKLEEKYPPTLVRGEGSSCCEMNFLLFTVSRA